MLKCRFPAAAAASAANQQQKVLSRLDPSSFPRHPSSWPRIKRARQGRRLCCDYGYSPGAVSAKPCGPARPGRSKRVTPSHVVSTPQTS